MKIQKHFFFLGGGAGGLGQGGGGGLRGGGSGWMCTEAFVKIKKKMGGRVGGSGGGAPGRGVRVDVNREVKFLSKFKKKN